MFGNAQDAWALATGAVAETSCDRIFADLCAVDNSAESAERLVAAKASIAEILKTRAKLVVDLLAAREDAAGVNDEYQGALRDGSSVSGLVSKAIKRTGLQTAMHSSVRTPCHAAPRRVIGGGRDSRVSEDALCLISALLGSVLSTYGGPGHVRVH